MSDVAIIMGSDSDWPVMSEAAAILDSFGITYKADVVSAHRMPTEMVAFAQGAVAAGFKVIIAGAGGAAHLPGMVASLTTLPVIGVPVPLKILDGMDSLLSIVQMPAGVPVATVGIGNRFLQAGIGFGGGCLPKDIRAFMARAHELGADQALEFLREIDAINLRARQRVIDVVRADLSEDLTKYKFAVLGATFKPDSDDVRDSPALDIAAQLQAAGAVVVVHDPKGIEPARKRFPNLDYAERVVDAVKDADAILHLTEWKEYRELDPSVIGQLVKSKFLIDGRNMLDRDKWRKAGWRVHALGRSD